jgi:hypothetical protein
MVSNNLPHSSVPAQTTINGDETYVYDKKSYLLHVVSVSNSSQHEGFDTIKIKKTIKRGVKRKKRL